MSLTNNLKNAAEVALKIVYPEDAKPNVKPDRLNQLAAFLAIPNQKPMVLHVQTIKNLAKNFLGLRDDILKQKNWLKKSLILPFIFWNMIRLPFNLLINTVRIFTEFLPLLFSEFFYRQAKSLLLFSKDQQLKHPWRTAATDALNVLGWFFNSIYIYGRCITSPILSVQFAWQYGHRFNTGEIAGGLLGAGFAVLSIGVTAAIFALLMPWLLTIFFGQAGVALLNQSAGFFAAIGKMVASIVSPYLTMTAQPVLIGFSVTLSLVITIPGTLLHTFLIEPFKTWWNHAIFIFSKNTVPSNSQPKNENTYPNILKKLAIIPTVDKHQFDQTENDWLTPIDFSEEDDTELNKEFLESLNEDEAFVEEMILSMLPLRQKF
jgi:hypothetical protein